MRNDGTHIPSNPDHETVTNRLHRFFLLIRGIVYTWWNKKRFGHVGRNFYAPGPIHVVNGRNITIGDDVFLGERCQLYVFPEGHLSIGDHSSIDRYVEIRGGKKTVIGKNVRIARGSTLKNVPTSNMMISDRTLISQGCILDGNFEIGSDVMFGPNVYLCSDDHGFSRRDIPINQQSPTSRRVVIEDDVWIGSQAVILKGVTIAKGSIIGANSVVTKTTQRYSITVGVPASLLKFRD